MLLTVLAVCGCSISVPGKKMTEADRELRGAAKKKKNRAPLLSLPACLFLNPISPCVGELAKKNPQMSDQKTPELQRNVVTHTSD